MRSATAVLVLAVLATATPANARDPGTSPPERPAPVAPRVEVAFVLDATGSMGPYIDEARERIKSIAADLARGTPAPQVRFALVSYRDRGDDYVTKVRAFTDSIDTMHGWLSATGPDGGGDHPEAALEGLHAAVIDLDWSADPEVLKLAYLIGDAPAKHYDDGPSESQVAAEARRRGIVIHTIACTDLGEEGAATWDVLARLTEGRMMALRGASRVAGGGHAGSGGGSTGLAAAVSGTARAYSTAVGVDFDEAPAIATAPLATPPVLESTGSPVSGLRGAHVRWIRDQAAWSDAWAAHTSVLAAGDRPAMPVIDFATHHVLVVGGPDAGLVVDAVRGSAGARAAEVTPVPGAGVSFVLVGLAEGGAR